MVVTMNTSSFIYYKHRLTEYPVLISDPAVICKYKVAKSVYQLCHMHLSVHLHGTTQFPLDRFLLNLVCRNFLKICHKNSSLVKIRQKYPALYMKTEVYFINSNIHNSKVQNRTHYCASMTTNSILYCRECHL